MGFREESNNENVGVNWWSWYLFSLAIKRVYCREQYSQNLSAGYYALTYYAILLWELGWWSLVLGRGNWMDIIVFQLWLPCVTADPSVSWLYLMSPAEMIWSRDWWQFRDPGDTWHLPPDTDTLTHPSCRPRSWAGPGYLWAGNLHTEGGALNGLHNDHTAQSKLVREVIAL